MSIVKSAMQIRLNKKIKYYTFGIKDITVNTYIKKKLSQ